jgi:hypothetical protein
MAFAYQEAGFEIGGPVALVKEVAAAGDEMEALYIRPDPAVIQSQARNFAPAEANLLTALSAVRAVGRKRAEPILYQEYALLIYPLTTTEPPVRWSLGIQLRSATGGETAARNLQN